MVIDKILDRKEGEAYTSRGFYTEMTQYGLRGRAIAGAMDSGTEQDVKRELCDYLRRGDYPTSLIIYVCSVNWL